MSRASERRDARKLRKKGPTQAEYGGNAGAKAEMRTELRGQDRDAKLREKDEYKQVTEQRTDSQGKAKQGERERRTSSGLAGQSLNTLEGSAARNDIGVGAAGARDLRNTALAQDQLTGTAERVLGQRANALAGSPTIGQATDTALAANRLNARDQLAQQIGLQNRQARGLAGSMGEGGALAMQQAMASAGAGAADLAAMNQTEQNQLAAKMRFDAAAQQRGEDVDTANLGLQARMGAAEQERAAQLGFAGQSAQENYNAGLAQTAALQNVAAQRNNAAQLATQNALSTGQQANAMSAGTYGAAAQNKQQAQEMKYGFDDRLYNVEQGQNQAAYESAMNRSAAAKLGKAAQFGTNLKATFDAFDMGPTRKLLGATKAE
jgi:enhancer of polycomb-like protein